MRKFRRRRSDRAARVYSPSAPVSAQGAPKNITVLANYTFHGRHSPFFVALDKGFFDQAGFKADIQPATGSGFVISAIESGKADYGLADASTTVQAIAKGSKVKGFQVYMDISTNGLGRDDAVAHARIGARQDDRHVADRLDSRHLSDHPQAERVSTRRRSTGSRPRPPPISRCS